MISTNVGSGVTLTGTGTTGNFVQGNFIGVNDIGFNLALGNDIGISITAAPPATPSAAPCDRGPQ